MWKWLARFFLPSEEAMAARLAQKGLSSVIHLDPLHWGQAVVPESEGLLKSTLRIMFDPHTWWRTWKARYVAGGIPGLFLHNLTLSPEFVRAWKTALTQGSPKRWAGTLLWHTPMTLFSKYWEVGLPIIGGYKILTGRGREGLTDLASGLTWNIFGHGLGGAAMYTDMKFLSKLRESAHAFEAPRYTHKRPMSVFSIYPQKGTWNYNLGMYNNLRYY